MEVGFPRWQAVAHVQTLGGSEAARLQYERIQAAHVAATSQHVMPATKVRIGWQCNKLTTIARLLSCPDSIIASLIFAHS